MKADATIEEREIDHLVYDLNSPARLRAAPWPFDELRINARRNRDSGRNKLKVV